jgi:glycerol-3-phosphate acyltransferase PlsY
LLQPAAEEKHRMNWGIALAAVAIGYVLGSLSFARMVGRRVVPGDDLSSTDLELPGGGTIEYTGVSATSIGARKGPRWGVVSGIGDILKAFIPVLAFRLVWPDDPYYLIVAVAVVVGHNYPVFHRFKGGRGQNSIYGGLLAIDWVALPVTTAVGAAVGLWVIRDMMWAYTLGQWLLIPWFVWRGGAPEIAYAVAVNLLFTIATVPEIKQYLEKRKAGELTQVASWKSFRTAHPAMGTGRHDEAQDSGE